MLIDDICKSDDLILPQSRIWAKTKHRKIKYYIELFATSMKKKWETRVYIDLFSSAGKTRVKESNEIIPGSPLLSLDIKDPFDLYIFVEENKEYLYALIKRVKVYFPTNNCNYICGDCNKEVQNIINKVPKFTKLNNGLTLCFIDPYNSSQLHFDTIKKIANNLYLDFLILIPSFMDINRNEQSYIKDTNNTLDLFLGTDSWRYDWKYNKGHYTKFGLFIADYFCNQMKKLDYLYEDLSETELIRMEIDQNLPLYHIAFFSRNRLGRNFWLQTLKNTNKQFSLFSI